MAWDSVGLWYLLIIYVCLLITAWPEILGGLAVRPFSTLAIFAVMPVICLAVLLVVMGYPIYTKCKRSVESDLEQENGRD